MKSTEFYSMSLGCVVEKITKQRAKRLYEDGEEVYLQPSNMPFDSMWMRPLNISFYTCEGADFDFILNEFRYYNCDNVRGKYIHFYIKK